VAHVKKGGGNSIASFCVLVLLSLKILILPVAKHFLYTNLIIVQNDQLEQFYFDKLSAD
jgi:hypothetical protein